VNKVMPPGHDRAGRGGPLKAVLRTAAVGAAVRQARLVNLIDLVRGGRLAVGLDPVVSAGLATGLL
jgi:hypothetical protein